MYKNRHKRNIVILSLLVIICLMVAGYAAFQTKLEVTSTSNIASNWLVKITDIQVVDKTGSAENVEDSTTYTDLTANIEANLYGSGDSIKYEVTISNLGNIDAILSNIFTNFDDYEDEAITITFSGYAQNQILKAKQSMPVYVTIAYNSGYTGGETSSEVTVNFEYTQNDSETNPSEDNYLITYDCTTNGGSSCTNLDTYVKNGTTVTLPEATEKSGYEFIGWNTDPNATTGFDSFTMIESDVTLYAIYKKEITITYVKGDAVDSIGRTQDTCTIYNNVTACSVILPDIEASNGYSVDGWYLNGTKIGEPNNSYAVNDNITLTAKGIDNIPPTTPEITNSSEEEWTNEDVTITITSTDEGSGIDHYEWYNGGEWTSEGITVDEDTGTITIETDMDGEIQFRAVDKAGNISETSITTVKRDTEAPTCTISDSGDEGNNGWYISDVSLVLNSYDNSSGVSTYDITTSATTSYNGNSTATITDDTSGITYYGYVMDQAGNTGTCNITVKKDTEAPTCTINESGDEGNNGWYTSNVNLSLDYSDALSGVGSYDMTTSATASYNGSSTATITSDTTGITYYGYVMDQAGNTSTCNTTVKKDATAPTCSLSINGTSGSNSWYRSNVTVSLTRSDATSGVSSYGISTSSSATYNGSTSVTQTADTNTITYYGYVMDAAGNTCRTSTSFKKDSTAPSIPYCTIKTADYLTITSTTCNGARDCYTTFTYTRTGNWSVGFDVVESDNLSGLNTIQQYQVTSQSSTTCNWIDKDDCYIKPSSITYPITFTNQYRAVDNAGNTSTAAECSYQVNYS